MRKKIEVESKSEDERETRPSKGFSREVVVQDFLNLPSFAEARVIAGVAGLDSSVRSVAVLEMAMPDKDRQAQMLQAMGDFSSCDEGTVFALIERVVSWQAAALVLKRNAFGQIPIERLVQMAEETGLVVIELPSKSDWILVCLECSDYLSASESVVGVQATGGRVLEQFRSDTDLQSIADTLSNALGTSLTIESADYRLLAHGAHESAIDSSREQTILTRRSPKLLVDRFEREHIFDVMRQTGRPIRVKEIPEIGFMQRVVCAIRAGREVIGYIWVLENNRRLNRTDMIILERAAAAAALSIVRGQATAERDENLKKDFVDEVLSGNVRSREELQSQAARLRCDLATFHQVLLADADDFRQYSERPVGEDGTETPFPRRRLLDIISAEVSKFSPGSLTVGRGKDVAALLSSDTRTPLPKLKSVVRRIVESIHSALQCELPGLSVSIGIGDYYADVTDLAESYREAQQAVRVAQRVYGGGRALFFDELGVYRLLGYLKDQQDLEKLRHPALERLKEYDCKENTEFLRTLEVFLENVGHPKAMAEQLCIHRNTLQYRLERIEAIAGASLSNAEDRLNLQIGLKLHKLLSP